MTKLARLHMLFTALALCASAPCNAQTVYDDFNTFCLQNFRAPDEPLLYETFGDNLRFIEDELWVHESRNSACIAFETNLPAKTYVQYGITASYGRATSQPERYFYLHLHHLTNLQPGVTYHYRLVAIDERGRTLTSSDRTLQTWPLDNAIPVPGALAGPPFVLDRADGYYLLTSDICAPTRAFTITGPRVTLDLNGYEVLYDEGPPLVANANWPDYVYSDKSTFGIYSYNNFGGCKIVNGRIRQGKTRSAGTMGLGFNPVYLCNTPGEVCGLDLSYSGDSVSGMVLRYADVSAHHNVIVDGGTVIDNRHQQIKAIWVHGNVSAVRQNLVKRTRQVGISSVDSSCLGNEIYIDSFDSNSFGIVPGKEIAKNRVFGTGYSMIGIGWSNGVYVHDNLVFVQGVAPTNRSDEYGTRSSVGGIRLTQYGGESRPYENNLYENNVIIVKAREGCTFARGVFFCSGPYVKNLVFRANVIKTEVQDERTGLAPCVVGHGSADRASEQLPVLYVGNRLITNSCHVRFGDDYACGGNHRFVRCALERIGAHTGYRTVEIGFWTWDTYNNRFTDCMVSGGADLERPVFSGSGRRDYSVGHRLQVRCVDSRGAALVGRTLSVRHWNGVVDDVVTGEGGRAVIEVLDYMYEAGVGEKEARRRVWAGTELGMEGFEPVALGANVARVRDNREAPVDVVFGMEGGRPRCPERLRVVGR